MSGAVAVAGVVGALVLLSFVAKRAGGLLGFILMVQVFYWTLAYVLRPGVLLVVLPRPRENDAVADYRLAIVGYSQAIAEILPIFFIFCLLYTAIVWLLSKKLVGSSDELPDFPYTFSLLLYGVGWACRLAAEMGLQGALISTLSGLAPLGAALLILRTPRFPGRSALLAVGLPLVGEVAYSILNESKTPLMTVLIFITLVVAGRVSHRKLLVAAPLLVALFAGAFSILQGIKTTQDVSSDLDRVDGTYPLFVRGLLPILRRFDLFSALTDSHYAGPSSWISPGQYVDRLMSALLPYGPWAGRTSSGVLWGREVRAQSISGGSATVSLADGVPAEGYVLGGWFGICLLSVVFAIAVCLVGKAVSSRSPFWQFLGVALLARPALFERGLLGMAETLGQMLQIAVVAYLGWLLWKRIHGTPQAELSARVVAPVRSSGR